MTRTSTPQAKVAVPALLTALALAVLALPGAAHATGTLDQQQSATGSRTVSNGSLAQTFTAGLSGQLDQVDLHLEASTNPPQPVTVEILGVDGSGAPVSANVLATISVPAESIPSCCGGAAFVPVTFSAQAQVMAGTKYAIVIYASSQTPYWSQPQGGGDLYPGGSDWVSEKPPTVWFALGFGDFAFKTYVTVAPTSQSQCKNGGWRSYPQFKNQGQCISFV